MAENHVNDLKNARDELVRQRRASISALAEGDRHTEHQLDTFVRYQEAIEAIDRLIKEEQRAAQEQRAAEIAASVQLLIKYED
jgi:dihydroneopterin aldolase